MGLISYILGSDSRAAVKKLNKLAVKVEELEQSTRACRTSSSKIRRACSKRGLQRARRSTT